MNWQLKDCQPYYQVCIQRHKYEKEKIKDMCCVKVKLTSLAHVWETIYGNGLTLLTIGQLQGDLRGKNVKTIFNSKGFEIVNSPDLNANKTILIWSLDRQIDEWDEIIMDYIMERNRWLKVENVIKLSTTNKIKVKCRMPMLPIHATEICKRKKKLCKTPCYNYF